VDTVGAGDTFAGVYAVGLCEGRTDPVSFANAAAALATLTPGAQAAIPFREAILATLCRPACG
jgi:ribokinase